MRGILSPPEPAVQIGGSTLQDEALRTLVEIRVQQRLSQPTLCELTFEDPEASLAESGMLRPGSSLTVRVSGSDDSLFDGEITAVRFSYGPSQERQVLVRGYDLLYRLRKREEVRSHVQVTAEELARELVADLGLSVKARTPGPLHKFLIQENRSDLDFLLDVADSCGLYLTLRDRTLYLWTLEGLDGPVGLELGDSLLEARVEINADPACQSVSVSGWNPLNVEHYDARASRVRVGREAGAEAAMRDTKGEILLSNEAGPDRRVAEGIAQAELDRRVAREVVLWGTAQGEPRLRPATRVSVKGVADAVAGRYVVTEATHLVDAQGGYVTEFSTLPPVSRARSKSAIAAKGVVTRVDDPDDLGRLKVSLPTYGDVETEWMGVLCPGAGTNKGFVALPDVGDDVLVLVTHEDPAKGVVLGGLYGAGGPPDSGVENGVVKRYTLLTPGKQKVQLDDGKKTIRLENSEGSYVELTPNKTRIHSKQDLDIEAPGRAVVIRGHSIDFRKA